MHAVYVPGRVGPPEVAWLEAAAPVPGGGGTLALYPAQRRPPHRTRLPAAQLQRVVRQWAQLARAGRGTLLLGDERRGVRRRHIPVAGPQPAPGALDGAGATRARRPGANAPGEVVDRLAVTAPPPGAGVSCSLPGRPGRRDSPGRRRSGGHGRPRRAPRAGDRQVQPSRQAEGVQEGTVSL